ncbi:MAG: cyclic nucleotide-binding domain-containing protein, partial [Myxococcales bacterium]|nr:cyclic nucleotide-binding domain-containing protein [Myxococcales bacterium]
MKLLAPLGDGDFEALMMFLRARSLSAGELLFRQGDPGETMVIVGEGSLAVRVRRAGGEEVLVAEIGPGEVVGEMAFIDPAARTASVVAVERATVYELSRDGLSTLRRA